MQKKAQEIKAITILLVILIIVCIAGYLLYSQLSVVTKDVSASYKEQYTPSLLTRQIIIECRDAENSVKSYNLTHEHEYLSQFYTSGAMVEQKIQDLQASANNNFNNRGITDSIISLSEKKFSLLKDQLFLDDEKKITEELNIISEKIKESYPLTSTIDSSSYKEDQVNTPVDPSSVKEKEGFLKRLFSKKKKEKEIDTLRKAIDKLKKNELKNEEILKKNEEQLALASGELSTTVEKVKKSQLKKLKNRQKEELEIVNSGKQVMDDLRVLYTKLELEEKQQATHKIELAKQKVNYIKDLSVIVSGVIALLLLVVSIVIISYSKKKKQYENALINARQQAEELAKTKESFLANMSHEIKTPLNAIYGFTEQVLSTKLNQQQEEQLTIVKRSASHLIKLISDLLNYSKIEAGKLKTEWTTVHIKNELNELEAIFKQQLQEKNNWLEISIDPDIPDQIVSDLTRLKQVFFNLTGNAIKYTENGKIKITVKNGIQKTKTQKLFLEITITDTGIGIPKNKIPKLFNEYEQAHSGTFGKYGGTGLGLVITKKIIEQSGGKIVLTSTEGKGTEVTFSIPYKMVSVKEPVKNAETIVKLNDTTVLEGKKILIADDAPLNRELLRAILLKYKTIVDEAIDGKEAVRMAFENNYDIIMMDINMPEKNGFEACQEIRSSGGNNAQVLIIAVTADSFQITNDTYTNAGFNGILYKPYTKEALMTTLTGLSRTHEPEQSAEDKTNAEHGKRINIDALDAIAEGDEQFKKDMILLFQKSLTDGYQQIEQAFHNNDWKKVSDVAHKTMAPCKHFDAHTLYRLLQYFENYRYTLPTDKSGVTKLQELKQEMDAINNELKLYS